MPPKPKPKDPHHLPGTTLEGGGQLLRIALSLSSLTGTAVRISRIRGNRPGGGGLKTQHLTSLQWLAAACGAKVSGVGLKSKEVTFIPGGSGSGSVLGDSTPHGRKGVDIEIRQSTPGSVGLVFQALLPFLLFRRPGASGDQGGKEKQKIRLLITGGTNVSASPSFEYMVQVLLPMFEKMGIEGIEATHSRGWNMGPVRMGWICFTIAPLEMGWLPGFELTERGRVKKVVATIIAPREAEQVFRDEVNGILERVWERVFGENGEEGDLEITFSDSGHEKRWYVLFVAETTTGMRLGRDWLYDRAIRKQGADAIVREMVGKVMRDFLGELEHGGCVDEYMRDQVVVYQGLARGRSEVSGGRKGGGDGGDLVEPSLHARTAQWVVNELLGVEFDDEGGCEGVGFGFEEEDIEGLVEGVEGLKV